MSRGAGSTRLGLSANALEFGVDGGRVLLGGVREVPEGRREPDAYANLMAQVLQATAWSPLMPLS